MTDWQLNDIWPGLSWSSLEFQGKWKMLHYESSKFFAPILLSIVEDEQYLHFWLTNDLEAVSGELIVDFYSTDGCTHLKQWKMAAAIGSQSSNIVYSLHKQELYPDLFKEKQQPNLINDANYSFVKYNSGTLVSKSNSFLQCKFVASNSQSSTHTVTYWACPLKQVQLPLSMLEVSNFTCIAPDTWQFTLVASHLATSVGLAWKNDVLFGYFSDNNFTMLAGEIKVITFTSWKPTSSNTNIAAGDLLVHSLVDTYQ